MREGRQETLEVGEPGGWDNTESGRNGEGVMSPTGKVLGTSQEGEDYSPLVLEKLHSAE